MVGDYLLFWRIGLFLCKNKGNGSTHSGEREMEQFSVPHFARVASIPAHGCWITAAGCEPQLRVRPGPGMGSTTPEPLPPPLPALAQSGALGTSHPSLWCCWAIAPWPVCSGLLRAAGHRGVLWAPLLRAGCCGMWHEGNEAALPRDRSQGSAPCSHGGGIKGYLFMHHPVWCNALALGWIRMP